MSGPNTPVTTNPAIDICSPARRLVREVHDGGDLAVLDEILTDDFVEHSLPPGFPANVEGLRALYPQLRTAFPDVQHTIDIELVDRNYVVHHCHGRATNSGPLFHGEPPTGRSVVWAETHIYRMQDERIAEHWGVVKVDSILAQLGVFEPRGPRPPASR